MGKDEGKRTKQEGRRRRTVNTVDLFCGAGGATTGLELALEQLGMKHRGIAINHWSVAVDTMKANHPDVDTKRMSIEETVPADLVPGGEVDLLWASPSCTHHSRAKGGKPRSNQLRAQPELILTWLDQLFVRRLIVENVPEFVEWGPLTKAGRPIESLKGACFRAWIQAIEARHYIVEWRVVNCADYGDPTSRRRFFLKAVRRGCGRIQWPEPTHAEDPQEDLWGNTLEKWRGVRECLDLDDLGRSIFEPGRNLALNTLRRVDVGMQKYNGISFLMDMLGSDGGDGSRVHPLTDPMPAQHAGGNRCALVQPFVVRMNKGCFAESVDKPLSSQQAHTVHHALCQPLILDHFKNGEARPADEPLGAQTTHDRFSVVQPFIVEHRGHGTAKAVDGPIGAQTTKDKFSLVSPVIVDMSHPGDKDDGRRVSRAGEPLKTITTRNNLAVCTPLVLGQQGGASARPIDEPCPTIATAGAIRLATPVILDMSRPSGNDSGHIRSADEPMRTVTTFDNMQIAIPVIFDKAVGLPRLPDGRYIDIFLRMLKPSELAAAHSFPADYKLTGNRGEQVKQIGNSVPVRTAAAMCRVDLAA